MTHDELSLVLDVPLRLSVELGRKTLTLAEVLHLGPGAVVELGKTAGESLDILVNGKLVARGEAVVVGEKYGVRIVEVIQPESAQGMVPANGAAATRKDSNAA